MTAWASVLTGHDLLRRDINVLQHTGASLQPGQATRLRVATIDVNAVQGACLAASTDDGRSRSRAAPASGAAAAVGEVDDAVLLMRLEARDANAFRTLVDRHLPALLGVGRRMLRDDAEAEDVAQEALVKLWQGAGALEFGPGGARPWLRRVVSNLCIDRIRSRRRTDVTDEVPDQEVAPDQLSNLIEHDLASRVDAAVRALPERQRLALTLFHYEGRSQIEVGAILGVSDEAVESLLSRARRTVRQCMQEDWRQLLPDET